MDDDAISMATTKDDQLRPKPNRVLTPDEDRKIVEVCPGVTVNGPFNGEMASPDPVWGDIRAAKMGWATDPEIRFIASAGGVMTAVNKYLLESGRAAFILQMKPGGPDALTSEPIFVRDAGDLLSGAQSRYAPSAPLTVINEALELNDPFAVSLKPCDIAGVRNLQRTDPRAARLIIFTIAMFCGTCPSRETSWKFLERKGENPAENPPTEFRWRGNGCPGPTVARWGDERMVVGTYNELWNGARWTTQFRCKICPDAIGLQADIATGDFWPGAEPKGESKGSNGVIAHTARGLDVMEACATEGYLTLRNSNVASISNTQPHHVSLRQTFATRVAAAVDGGHPSPDFRNLAAEDCTAMLSDEEHAATYQGTLTRVQAGQGDESSEFGDWGEA